VPERLLLVGMMGAGKSTVGRLVARSLGWRFRDLDDEIERESGASVPELFAERGEVGFRALESEALARHLAGDEQMVMSVGGGAVLSEPNRSLLPGAGTVVWLRARPATLAARVGAGNGRPLLAGGQEQAAARVAELAAVRAPLYRAVAEVVVDVDGRTPKQVADRVVAAWRARQGHGARP
jgi:shikimate kinase